MNPVIENIKSRRSVRSYRPTPVPRELVKAIIDAGNWAPTGNNRQRWRFVVVDDGEFRQKMVCATRPNDHRVIDHLLESDDEYLRQYFVDFYPKCLGWPRQSFEDTMRQARELDDGVYWGAPVVIFVIGSARPVEAAACSMVCQNMMLSAQSLGVGSCIVGFGALMGDPEIVEALELQDGERIYGPVVFGYPAIVPEPPPKRPPTVKWI